MASWVVAPLNTVFPQRLTKSLIDYIYTNYSLTDPLKTDFANMVFREGFYTLSKPYQITVLEQNTDINQLINTRDQDMYTLMYINIRMNRLQPQGVEPQLWDMREEVIRILGEYQTYDIPGVRELRWQGGMPEYVPNSDARAQAEQDWRYIIKCTMHYEMRNIAP